MTEGRMSGRVLVAVFAFLLLMVATLAGLAGRLLFGDQRPDEETLQRLSSQQAQAKQDLMLDLHKKRLRAGGQDASVPASAIPLPRRGKSGDDK